MAEIEEEREIPVLGHLLAGIFNLRGQNLISYYYIMHIYQLQKKTVQSCQYGGLLDVAHLLLSALFCLAEIWDIDI